LLVDKLSASLRHLQQPRIVVRVYGLLRQGSVSSFSIRVARLFVAFLVSFPRAAERELFPIQNVSL
jgi:hypothetical protein